MTSPVAYPRTHTEAVEAIEKRKKLYMQIAQALVSTQNDPDNLLNVADLITRVTDQLQTQRTEVATVYWELANHGYFDLNAKPLFTLQTPSK